MAANNETHFEDGLSDSLHELLEGISSSSNRHASIPNAWHTNSINDEHVNETNANASLNASGSSSNSTTRASTYTRGRAPHVHRDATGGDSPTLASAVSPPPPARSIFASGPPTSSISANTAHASLSRTSASGSTLPLSALTSSGFGRRSIARPADLNMISATASIPGTEKDVDDFDAGQSNESSESELARTSQRLSSLFVSDTPGLLSRETTQIRHVFPRSPPQDSSTLSGHLLHNGFIAGRHSDITIQAFGQSYKLHKLILDRAPYFSTAFCGPWTESSASEMKLDPGEIDQNITKNAFELALKRLYGTAVPSQEEKDAIGLFATACWLDMPELVDTCVDYILQQMSTTKLHCLIKLVTTNFYGRPGDRILASSKAMLCREGYEMPYENWDEIPAEIIREIIGGDYFYVPGEWERWFLSLKIFNRRLRRLAIDSELVDHSGRYLHPKPQSLKFFAVRFDTTYRRDAGIQHQWNDKDDVWCSLYTSAEISPLLVLLDEGIHYVHLRFEQLQYIRSARDILGVPVLPEKVVSDALWMQMELRQRVMNAHEGDLELGLSESAEGMEETEEETLVSDTARGKQRADASLSPTRMMSGEMDSGSWDGNGRPRKFWIPTSDISCIVGGVKDAVASPAATSSGDWNSTANRLSATLEPSDVGWAVDFAGSVFDNNSSARNLVSTSSPQFSHYPPFRFSAEFPNPRTLKEKKRVYSQTVWYAGSMWNIYIQRVNTSKGQQLGIYLHRAKDRDPTDDPLAQFVPASVDDRIGQLEREMLLRKSNPRQQSWHEQVTHETERISPEFDVRTSTLLSPSRSTSFRDQDREAKTSQTPAQSLHTRPSYLQLHSMSNEHSDRLDMGSNDLDIYDTLTRANQHFASSISAMPPYTDSRSTIKTYFKIYSPSKAGRLLSVYESAPDSFNFGKSWGWKSSSLVLDDGINCDVSSPGKAPTISLSGREGKLRYMVVIGIV